MPVRDWTGEPRPARRPAGQSTHFVPSFLGLLLQGAAAMAAARPREAGLWAAAFVGNQNTLGACCARSAARGRMTGPARTRCVGRMDGWSNYFVTTEAGEVASRVVYPLHGLIVELLAAAALPLTHFFGVPGRPAAGNGRLIVSLR